MGSKGHFHGLQFVDFDHPCLFVLVFVFFFPDKFVVIIMIDSNVPGGYSGIIVTGRYTQGPFCGFEIWDLS